jgi:hypothetical protein
MYAETYREASKIIRNTYKLKPLPHYHATFKKKAEGKLLRKVKRKNGKNRKEP